jgi:PTH1 family peptidyl-tRNA hydrolase
MINESPLRLVVGLGNPGAEYESTRHNIGFMAVDQIASHFKCTPWKSKFKGQIAASSDPAFLLLKPMTYMNLSGEAVGEAIRFHKIMPEQVIVLHDDLDVTAGQVRIKQGGGSGGHNGIKSIDQHIGQNYWRVRIGIGHPGEKGDVVTNYVLGNFANSDAPWVGQLLTSMADHFKLVLDGKMNDFLGRLPAPKHQN